LETLGATLGFSILISRVKTLASEKIIQPGAEKRKAAGSGKARTTAAKLA
jgi:hypothetical protein